MAARAWLAGIGALFALAGAAHAQQATAESPEYRKTIGDAVEEFRDGHWEEARALFGRAHELEPSARTLRGLGMTAFELRMYVQSMRELDAALRETRKPLDAGMRANAEALILKARAFVARVQIVPNPKDAVLVLDGRPLAIEPDGRVSLDAGLHVVSATADGYKPSTLRFAVEGGRDQTLQLPLEPILALPNAVPAIDPNRPAQPQPVAQPEQPAPPPVSPQEPAPPPEKPSPLLGTLAWVTLGGAVAFGGAATATWLIAEGKYSDFEDECGTECEPDAVDKSSIRTLDTLTTVFLPLAIASGVASGVLFAITLSDSGEQAPSGGGSVALQAAPGAVQLRGTF